MPKKVLTYNEQLNEKNDLPKVQIELDPRRIKMFKGNRLLLPGALEVNDVMSKVPKGKLMISKDIREFLAKQHEADYTCPVTTARHIILAAKASDERTSETIPFWRTLKNDGQMNLKYPGGIEFQSAMLRQEGFEIIQIDNKYFVHDYKKYLVKF